jgi:hypothetical protein
MHWAESNSHNCILLKFVCVFGIILFATDSSLMAENNDSIKGNGNNYSYPYIIQDSPARLFTMRQFNQDYLSSYRYLSLALDKSFHPIIKYSIEGISMILVLGTLSHEEGHRSILTAKNIGSISQPFYFSKRNGFVDGVTDQTLKNLRDSDFADYIRLYTAGSESDYMLGNHEETLMAFGDETFRNLAVEYLIRKGFLIEYYLIGFFHYDVDGAEENNELKRDIVGNDIYGTARHLFRPTMPFYRYTRFNDLTSQEKNYVYKMGYRSLLNLVNPNIVGIPAIVHTDNLRINFGMGHILCPFGDLTDENLWLVYNEFKFHAYIREFQNRSNWFMAGGISLLDYPIISRIQTCLTVHWWKQPKDFDFNEVKGIPGGALEFTGKYFFHTHSMTALKRISVDLGVLYKSKGYLPEEVYLSKHFGFRFGTTLNIE